MTDIPFVLLDDGQLNARILAKVGKADFRRVQAACIKVPTCLFSTEAKHLFARFFSSYQLNMYLISDIARLKLPSEEIAELEAELHAQLVAAAGELNQAIDVAATNYKVRGITHDDQAGYDTVPLELRISVYSSYGRRYLEIIEKFDQLIMMWRTLVLHERYIPHDFDQERMRYGRVVRRLASRVRRCATDLRRRMDALDAWKARGGQGQLSRRKGEKAPSDASADLPAATAWDANGNTNPLLPLVPMVDDHAVPAEHVEPERSSGSESDA